MSNQAKWFNSSFFKSTAVISVMLAGLYLTTYHSYLLFHCLAELFSIVVATSIFLLVWNVRDLLENNYLRFIGIAYLFVALFDLLHTLSYSGIGIIVGYGVNLPTQLWIISRYLESATLILAPLMMNRRFYPVIIICIFSLLSLLVLAMVFFWNNFPICFIEGQGLTLFKMSSEYIICLILIVSGGLLFHRRSSMDRHVVWLLLGSILTMILSELSFTLYSLPFGLMNKVGHLFKIISFYMIYKAIVETGLKKPYTLLFRQLQKREADLQRERALMERMVLERTSELSKANQDLEEFTYMASHDLQAPLRKIQTFSERLMSLYSDRLGKKGADYIERMHKAAGRLRNLIDALLTYSRISTRKNDLAEVDLNLVLDDVVEDLEELIDRCHGRVESDRLAIIEADPSQMHQLFQNLIHNGLKFNQQDEPLVRLHGQIISASQTESAASPDPWYRLHIEDNGIGMDEANWDEILKPFQRLHSTAQYDGTGIGLAICQKIIHRHGGTLALKSRPGEGSVFIVDLPIKHD